MSAAIYDLNLTPGQFWSMTPAQLNALFERYEIEQRRTDARFGMVVSTIINVVVGKSGKPVGPLEVMGYDEGERQSTDISPENREKLAQQEIALRFRLMQAGMRRSGVKG